MSSASSTSALSDTTSGQLDYTTTSFNLSTSTSTAVASTSLTNSTSDYSVTSTGSSRAAAFGLLNSTTTASNKASSSYLRANASGLITAAPSLGTVVFSANATGTIIYSGDCWQQWNEYWNASANASFVRVQYTTTEIQVQTFQPEYYTTVSSAATLSGAYTTTVTKYGPQDPFESLGADAFAVATTTEENPWTSTLVPGETLEVSVLQEINHLSDIGFRP